MQNVLRYLLEISELKLPNKKTFSKGDPTLPNIIKNSSIISQSSLTASWKITIKTTFFRFLKNCSILSTFLNETSFNGIFSLT